MNQSLIDQLKKTGLVNEQQVKTAKKEKQKASKKKKGGANSADSDKGRALAQQEQAKKVARDKELNRQREAAVKERALLAQVKQLVETHQLDTADGEVRFNFADAGKVRRIYVTPEQQDLLSKGRVGIVQYAEKYFLVPDDIAKKISERKESALVYPKELSIASEDSKHVHSQSPSDDDHYAKYQIPDDLMW